MAHSNKTVTRPEQGVQKLNAGPSAHEKQSSPEPLDAERSFDSRPFTSAVSWDIGRMPIDPPEFAVRPEVRICDPNDPLEREAEMSNPAAMKASTPRAGGVEAPPIVHSALEREGKPLGNSVRNRMESYFGHDFSRVRIHDDPLAAESANSIQARAYTVGHDIVMGTEAGAPDTGAGAGLLTHELTHVVQHDARASHATQGWNGAAAILNRAPKGAKPSGGGSGRRIVYLDNNVLGELAGGNQRVVDAFNKMQAEGAETRIIRYVYQEASSGQNRVAAGARVFIVQERNITVVDAGEWESQAKSMGWFKAKGIQVETKDAPVVKAALEAGPGVELWSMDGGPVQAAREARVKVAPESILRHGSRADKHPDVRKGLASLGLGEWDITAEGQPIRRPVVPPGRAPAGRPTRTRGPNPAPVEPASKTVSGTIDSSKRGPGGGSGPGGDGEGEATGGAKKASKPSPGEPVEAITTRAAEKKATAEGFLMMLHQKQIENLQQDEVDKFQRDLDARMPAIEAARAEGKDVAVTLIVLKQPPNVLHGVFAEHGDIVRYYDIRVDDNPWWANSDPALNLQAREASKSGTQQQQIRAQMGDRFPMEPTPPAGLHYDSVTEVMKSTKPVTDGTYRASGVAKMFSGNPQHAQSFGLDRTLFVHASRFKMLDIEMRSGSVKAPRPESGREPPRMNAGPPSDAARSGKADPNAFVPDPFAFPLTAQGQLNAQQDSWYGVFIKGTPGAPGSYRIKSSGTLFQAKGKAMILEVVEGEDLDPQWSLGGQGKWSAAILWERL